MGLAVPGARAYRQPPRDDTIRLVVPTNPVVLIVMRPRVLVSWIGHNDLRPMAAAQSEAKCEEILGEIGPGPAKGGGGPIKTLIDQESFDRVILLSNYKSDWSKRYARWLGDSPVVERVKLANPTDYPSIYVAADKLLGRLRRDGLLKSHELAIHLSPGTPAMAAVWLLLGTSKYPATFFQTFQGKAWRTEIPFDLTVDFLPDLFAEPDSRLQHLAAKSPGDVAGFEEIIGTSQAIRTAVGRSRRAAIRGVPVLLLGESGVGKEMFARAIHNASPRRDQPFVAVNCAAIARDLLESELFGHVKGAFTGADANRRGAFTEADGGTLFLDEVGECSLDMQAKLLRVLQPPSIDSPCQRMFRPVGATADAASNVRIIAATNRDLVKAVGEGRFREDLYYRLAVVTVNLPPLRDRRQDIPEIAVALLARINRQLAAEGEPGYRHKSLSDAAKSFVKRWAWPGNVRQLYNVLLQAAVMGDGEVLDRADIEAALGEMPSLPGDRPDVLERPLGDGFVLEDHLNSIRAHYLRRAMAEAAGVKAEASRLLGMANYQTLDQQLKRLDVTENWK